MMLVWMMRIGALSSSNPIHYIQVIYKGGGSSLEFTYGQKSDSSEAVRLYTTHPAFNIGVCRWYLINK